MAISCSFSRNGLYPGQCLLPGMKKSLCLRVFSIILSISALFASFQTNGIAYNSRMALGCYWPDTPCDVFFRCDFATEKREEVRDAMQEWNSIRSYSNHYMVSMFLTRDENETNRIFDDPVVQAVAYTYHYYSDGGALYRVEIGLRSSYRFSVGGSATSFDIRTVVQHELGHALGVAHCHEQNDTSCFSATCSQNVMNPSIAMGEVRTTFQAYDIGSYKNIYS